MSVDRAFSIQEIERSEKRKKLMKTRFSQRNDAAVFELNENNTKEPTTKSDNRPTQIKWMKKIRRKKENVNE